MKRLIIIILMVFCIVSVHTHALANHQIKGYISRTQLTDIDYKFTVTEKAHPNSAYIGDIVIQSEEPIDERNAKLLESANGKFVDVFCDEIIEGTDFTYYLYPQEIFVYSAKPELTGPTSSRK